MCLSHVKVTAMSEPSVKACSVRAAEPGVPIAMHIMSGGGKVYAGLAILDVMRALTSPVHTTCLGHCESMAAVLLACGVRVRVRVS